MAILASFIGIDKYSSLVIRDLAGARRDATALWALFTDSIPNIQSELIIDTDATVERIYRVFDETLEAATSDDVVILSFAGHGSPDHRLVVHNTDVNALEKSTISMTELAQRFKNSKAKAILCILDCCFSGGAPARVFEDGPVPRNLTNPLNEISGKGRIILAASNFDEPSYELPNGGHGILTKALLDVFQEGEGDVEIQAVMSRIMDRVRADAARIGVTQTPVMAGSITGGLTFPVLKPGKNFISAFPETQGITITKDIQKLAQYGLPNEVITVWSQLFQDGLNEVQLKAVNDYRILDGKSLLVVAPTSSGKTFIGELATVKTVTEGRKAVFLLPYRALVNEKYEQFTDLYGNRVGMRVIRCTGDYSDQTGAFMRGKYDLALLTYEMFLNLALNTPSLMNQIGLVVLDEAQFITDPNRGINVELLLTYLLTLRERGVAPQLICLSAVIGNTNDFDQWLGCEKLVTSTRPVPLIEGVLDRSGIYQYVDANGAVKSKQLLPIGAIRQRRDKPSMQDVIVPLVQSLVKENEKVIVFRNQKGKAQGAANYLAKDLGLPAATEVINQLPNTDLSTTSRTLRECLTGGTAFHNANLTREERVIVERAFRDSDGPVRILAATTTVAAGINTPASTVILAEQEFVGEDGRKFTVAEYKNMAGRAGRLGFNESGKSIILAETAYQREELFQKYVQGQIDILHSSFDPEQLDNWVIRLLAQIHQVPRTEVSRLLSNTYGGYLITRSNPKWKTEIEMGIEELLRKMISLDLIEQEGEFVQLTLLGRACGRSSLSLASAMRLVELLKGMTSDQLTPEVLMALVQVLPESDGGYTPMMKRGNSESVRPNEAAHRYGRNIAALLQRYAKDSFDYYARCKRACILWDWIHGEQIENIEQTYSPNPYQGRISHGEVRKFADNTRFHLRSAHEISSVMLLGNETDADEMEILLKQLELGLPKETLELLSIPIPFPRGEYLVFYHQGIKTADELQNFSEETLQKLISADSFERIKEYKNKLTNSN
jgi:replicative superfamily II helicase